jgi:ubiquinone biosynthesis protein UbiJ
MNQTGDNECKDLKDALNRLQDQHLELIRKIEGDEGAKAALESLQNENRTLKESLESIQKNHAEQSCEGSTKLYNTVKDVEKLQSEIKKLDEARTSEIEEWKIKHQQQCDQIAKQVC